MSALGRAGLELPRTNSEGVWEFRWENFLCKCLISFSSLRISTVFGMESLGGVYLRISPEYPRRFQLGKRTFWFYFFPSAVSQAGLKFLAKISAACSQKSG